MNTIEAPSVPLSDDLAEVAKLRAKTVVIEAQTALLRAENEAMRQVLMRQALQCSLFDRPWFPFVAIPAAALLGMGFVAFVSWLR